ncbi:MAG: di-trans,poly-cis-decaprenylcistransferase [Deltaproteobacteria bacterium]|nr:di-trans,poly-cis-decaprenylcistransferase [Deltaproteobacteria bacterium]
MSETELIKVPQHLAIIMDGNGRWAESKNLPRLEGHRLGSESVEKVVEACSEWGIKELTLYAFSQENWQRPTEEVASLMDLLKIFLAKKRQKLLKNKISLKAIGRLELLPESVLRELTQTIEATRHGDRMILTLALSYGSRQEIIDTANQGIRHAMSLNDPAWRFDEKTFDEWLYTEGRTAPDLLIRTSGERRISNFLLWQLAYAELYFTETLWPDFDEKELKKALLEYQSRERRFGKTPEQIQKGQSS